MEVCEYFEWFNEGEQDCINCPLGNPCLGCDDYDAEKHKCRSNGACGADMRGEKDGH